MDRSVRPPRRGKLSRPLESGRLPHLARRRLRERGDEGGRGLRVARARRDGGRVGGVVGERGRSLPITLAPLIGRISGISVMPSSACPLATHSATAAPLFCGSALRLISSAMPIRSNSPGRNTAAVPPTEASVKAIARASSKVWRKASGVVMSGAGRPRAPPPR